MTSAYPRVLVTGIGIVGPLGHDRLAFWEGVLAGRSGIAPITSSLGKRVRDAHVGRVVDLNLLEQADRPHAPGWTYPRAATIALAAGAEARRQSGLRLETIDPDRVGVYLGSCTGGWPDDGDLLADVDLTLDARRAEPPPIVMAQLADLVAASIGATGPRLVISTACAAGAHAFGPAVEAVLDGAVDVAFCGGVDQYHEFSVGAFSGVGAVDPRTTSPYGRSDGLNIGEGGAFLILERADRASARGAVCVAEVLGYGFSADAYGPIAPDPSARGARLAVERALERSGLGVADIDYVNGHGTGTPANDAMEVELITSLFGDRIVPVSSLKAATGHAFGGSAAMEAAICSLAVASDTVPGTAHTDPPTGDLDVVVGAARPAVIDVAMSTSYAFGGNNACLIIGKVRPDVRGAAEAPRGEGLGQDVAISGIGAVGPGGIGREAWWSSLIDAKPVIGTRSFTLEGGREITFLAGDVPPLDAARFTSPRKWRRMDALGQRCLAAVRLALEDAGIEAEAVDREDIGVLVATDFGHLGSAMDVADHLRHGTDWNPSDLANSVMNAAAGHICLTRGWRGPTSTFMAGWTSSVHAVLNARTMLQRGDANVVVVVAGDVLTARSLQCSTVRGDLSQGPSVPFGEQSEGMGLAGSAVALVMERVSDCASSGRPIQARVLGGAARGSGSFGWDLPTSADLWKRTIHAALRSSDAAVQDVGLVVAAANGVVPFDSAEHLGLVAAGLGSALLTAPKGVAGESLAADGALGGMVAAGCFTSGLVPPIAGLDRPVAGLESVCGKPADTRPGLALINTASPGGSCASLVLAAP